MPVSSAYALRTMRQHAFSTPRRSWRSLALALALAVSGALHAAAPDTAVAELQARHAWVLRATAALENSPPDPAFVKYRNDYLAALPLGAAQPLARSALDRRLKSARVVLLGDQHDSPVAKRLALHVLTAMRAGGAVTLAIEFIQPKFQAVLDAYTAGRIDDAALRDQAYKPSSWSFAWPLYRELFVGARAAGVRVVAVEPGTHLSLSERDTGIASNVRAIPGRVLVFYGSFHLLGRDHLADKLGADLTITPSAQERYWEIARRQGLGFDLLELSPRVVFANLGSPLDSDSEYLDSLMDTFGYGSLDELARDFPDLPARPVSGGGDPARPSAP